MANRVDIYINGTHLGYTQKAEIKEELSNDTLPTFDGPVPDLGGDPTYEVSCDVLRYSGNLEDFLNIKRIIRTMKTTPKDVKLVENVTFASGETAKITQTIQNCTVSSNTVSFDAETRTVTNLSFKGTNLKEFSNDTEF